MTPEEQTRQLELFEFSGASGVRPVRTFPGRVSFQLRYDQAILTGIAGIVALTAIFACGVERGKELVRGEHLGLARQQEAAVPSTSSAPSAGNQRPSPAVSSTVMSKPPIEKKMAPSGEGIHPKRPQKLADTAPPSAPVVQSAEKIARSRYAVQVVTLTRPQVAKRVMDRLQARGERAFLVMRNGRTMVYVGPFPTKGNASEKLADLKTLYQDCFVRTL